MWWYSVNDSFLTAVGNKCSIKWTLSRLKILFTHHPFWTKWLRMSQFDSYSANVRVKYDRFYSVHPTKLLSNEKSSHIVLTILPRTLWENLQEIYLDNIPPPQLVSIWNDFLCCLMFAHSYDVCGIWKPCLTLLVSV